MPDVEYPCASFGIGSAFSSKLKLKVKDALVKKGFWQLFSKIDHIEKFSSKLKDESNVQFTGFPILCKQYIDALSIAGHRGFSCVSENQFSIKSYPLENIFLKLSISNFSNHMMMNESNRCFLDRCDSSDIPDVYAPFIASYFSMISDFCPLKGTCKNSDKILCLNYSKSISRQIIREIDVMMGYDIYCPITTQIKGFSEDSWCSFEQIEAESNFERAFALFERTLYGLAFQPIGYESRFYSVRNSFDNSTLSADLAYALNDIDGLLAASSDIIGLAGRDTQMRVEKTLLEKSQYSSTSVYDAKKATLIISLLLEEVKEQVRIITGLKVDVDLTLRQNISILDRKKSHELLTTFKSSLLNTDFKEFLGLWAASVLNRTDFNEVKICLFDSSVITGGTLLKAVNEQMQLDPQLRIETPLLILLHRDAKPAQPFKSSDLHLLRILSRTNLINPSEIEFTEGQSTDGLEKSIQNLTKDDTIRLIVKDFDAYLDAEDEVNRRFWNGKEWQNLPTNKDVYSLLKGIILGKKDLIFAPLRHFYRDIKEYRSVSILVFDGLGYIPLFWTTRLEHLSTVLRKPLLTGYALSVTPSLTAVNHCALIANEEIHEDYMLQVDSGASENSITKTLAKFQDFSYSNTILDCNRALLNYTNSGEFISYHKPDGSNLSKCISEGCGSNYKMVDSYVNAIRECLRTEKKVCISQVNILDKYLEAFQRRRIAENPNEYYEHAKNLVESAFHTIDENIEPERLVVIVSDHGLGWWRSENSIRPFEIAEEIASCIGGRFSAPKDEEGGIDFVIEDKPILMMKPESGPRRVASIFPLNIMGEKMISKIRFSEGITNSFDIRLIKNRRSFDPGLVLVAKDKIIARRRDNDKYFVGLHGGISAQEMIVPVMCFSYDDWMSREAIP